MFASKNLLLLLILTILANAVWAHTMCKGLYKHSHALTYFSLIQLSEVGTTATLFYKGKESLRNLVKSSQSW